MSTVPVLETTAVLEQGVLLFMGRVFKVSSAFTLLKRALN